MSSFTCEVCGHKPLSKWQRLRNMHKGVYSERYQCPSCKSMYKISTAYTTIYNIFVLLLIVGPFFSVIPFLITVIVFFSSYPIYLIYSPLVKKE